MTTFVQDLRLGIRGFRRNPGFTLLAVTVLALAIGANTAIFSIVNALVLGKLPYAQPETLVTIQTQSRETGRIDSVSFPDMADVRTQSRALADLALYRLRGLVMTGPSGAETVNAVIASARLWKVLGVEPALGRGFVDGEDEPGRSRVAVVSHGFWQQRLGGDPRVLGRTLSLEGDPFTIIGVAGPGFRFPLDERAPDLWVPLDGGIDREARRWRSMMPYRSAVARLRSGVTVAQAQSELTIIRERLAKAHPKDDGGSLFVVRSFHDAWIGASSTALLVLLGAVGFVLLIGCANLANLQLSRALAREREFAIRRALGADRRRLVRQLLAESLLLAFVGGILGIALARLGLDALVAVIPGDVPRHQAVVLDWRVLLYALGITIGSGVIVGVLPAVLATALDVRGTIAGPGSRGAGKAGTRAVLLVVEVALAVILVIGAGLLVRTFAHVSGLDPGFDSRSMLTARIRTSARQVQGDTLYRELKAGLERIGGAEGAAIAAPLPFAGRAGGTLQFTLHGRPAPPAEEPWWLVWHTVSPGYLRTMGIPLRRGRFFDTRDEGPQAPKVAVINEAFARRHFPDGDPLGQRVLAYNQFDWRIVGVVADTRGTTCPPAGCHPHDGAPIEQGPEPALYTSLGQRCCGPDLYVVIRHPSPMSVAGDLRTLVRSIDPRLPVEDLATMDEAIGRSLAGRRLNTMLLSLFSTLALFLAALGIFGTLSHAVAQRTKEIAIRMALGAQAAAVARLVVGQGMRLAGIGLVVGLAGALALTRLLASQLYSVTPTDPLTFLALAVLVLAVSALASLLPARRATRIDPMATLRQG